MTANEYAAKIATARTLDELNAVIESAAFDDELTNDEYTALYNRAEFIARTWNTPIN